MDIESVLAIVGIFFLPIIMVVLIVYFRSREQRAKRRMQAELYAKALELGREIPAGVFTEERRKKNPLNSGIILISVGVGITLFFGLKGQLAPPMAAMGAVGNAFAQGAAIGAIPFCIGLANLLIHFLGKKQQENNG